MADRAAIEEAFKQHRQGMSLTDALNAGIMAVAQMGIVVGSNRTGVVRGGVLKGPGPRGGESSAAAYGRMMHQKWNPGPGWEKEYRLPSGRRIDAINWQTRRDSRAKAE